MINVLAVREGENSILAKSIYSDLKGVFDDVLIFRNPQVPENELDNMYFLASDSGIQNKKLILNNSTTLNLMLQNPFTYNETLNFENTDDFTFIEKHGLKIREMY